VISNNIQNELDRQIIIATITSNKKEFENKADYEVILKSEESNGIDIESKILLNRIQTIFKEHKNRKPFIKKIGSISEEK
jgi:mRNA-degrading endonuclease toxin of MazEF toxin-antitoxin module